MGVVDDVVGLWDKRHGQASTLSSGGFISLGETGNHALYTVRLAQLMNLSGATWSPSAPMHTLDAGCGKGIFSRGLAAAGVRASGFDPSPNAIDYCRSQAGPREDYTVNTATDYPGDRLFDLVYSIDVMFHIMNDDEWGDSVRRLCALVRLGGRLAIVDHARPVRRQWSDYQMTRPPSDYYGVFEGAGLQPMGLQPCGPPGYPTAFIIGRRTH